MNVGPSVHIDVTTHQNNHLISGTSVVAPGGNAVLIVGSSGSGKSALALNLMAFGATLIGDDRVVATSQHNGLTMTAPDEIAGKIEARGVGILKAEHGAGELAVVVSMDHVEADRLPPARNIDVLGFSFPLLHKVESVHFAAAVWQYLLGGRIE